ncbi:MAG: acyltransferase [Sphingomonas adhaesiva]|uniref:acyltransferase family protein n=1 Tax=Sphingomonas adhaesiva TaxID=28212 RepID=UPI002FF8B73A
MSHPAPRKYYPLLDAIRMIASVMIVMYHLPAFFSGYFPRSYLAVDIFFVLSGFVIANAYEGKLLSHMSFSRFAIIRGVRLLPLYYVGLGLAILAYFVDPTFYASIVPVGAAIVLAILLLPVISADPAAGYAYPLNGPTWSLSLELVINFAYALFLKRLSNIVIAGVAIVSAVILIGLSVKGGRHAVDFGWSAKNFPGGAFRVGYSFSIGVLLYRYRTLLTPFPDRRIVNVIFSALACCAVTAILAAPRAFWGDELFDLLVIFVAFPLIVVVAMNVELPDRIKSVLSFFGVSSYSIYVLHVPVSGIVISLLGLDLVRGAAPVSGAMMLGLLLLMSWLLDRHLERPFKRFMNAAVLHRTDPVQKMT